MRIEDRINDRWKTSGKDDKYFKLTEKYLYNEISTSLNISYDDVKKYVIDRVNKKSN